jgi:hypothetical protein
MPALTVQNAEIKTAAVEVRTLTISGKQVTLAVFRQLLEADLIAEDGTLNGVPWGTVNYHPDKCADGSKHWHIVWQRGSDLLRARVQHRIVFGPLSVGALGSQFLEAHMRDVAHDQGQFWNGEIPTPRCVGRDYQTNTTVDGMKIDLWWSDEAVQAREAYDELASALESEPDSEGRAYCRAYGYKRITKSAAVRARHHELDEATAALCQKSTQQLFADIRSAVADESARRQRHHDQLKAVADLPQLFIAV